MTSVLSAPSVVGHQRPRYECVPLSNGSAGQEAVALAASAGLVLDPWQAYVLENSLGERVDGRWAAREVGLIVSRQNGKGSILEARELAGLFLLDEMELVHTAHQFKTSSDHFLRIKQLIVNTPDLYRQVKPRGIRESHGEEGITLTTGARLRFVARSVNGSGRGFAQIDFLAIDEAFEAQRAALASLLPMQLAAKNAQTWYTSSVEDRGPATDHLKRLRDRGRAGQATGLAYFEWSAPDDSDADDPDGRAAANPGLGIRLAYEDLQSLRDSQDELTFRTEHLSIWPELNSNAALSATQWGELVDAQSRATPLAFAVEVSLDRGRAAIGVAGNRVDGLQHVELVEQHRGTDWVVRRCVELNGRHGPVTWVVDGGGPANSLIEPLEAAGLKVLVAQTRDVGLACAAFTDAVTQETLRHGPQPELDQAVAGAKKRPLGDGAFAFGRKASTVDISALQAVTLAHWAAATAERPSIYETRGMVVVGASTGQQTDP
jgi:hypothetical protein